MIRRMSNRDDVLISEYAKIADKSSEAIIRDDKLSLALVRSVNSQLPKETHFKKDEMKKRLENLRKGGKLPKKFREFNGRNLGKTNPK